MLFYSVIVSLLLGFSVKILKHACKSQENAICDVSPSFCRFSFCNIRSWSDAELILAQSGYMS